MPRTWFLILILATARAQSLTRTQAEEFLSSSSIVSERRINRDFIRLSLDDGKLRHDATIQYLDTADASRKEAYRLNVVAYELDKMLELNLVVPSTERIVNGRPAVMTWFADNIRMSEQDRRKANVQPPDPDLWNKQMQAARLFDELIANTYRDIRPEFLTTTLWDNLLITMDWRIRLIDHKASFLTTRELAHPESLTRCDRAVLGKLRTLNRNAFTQKLGKFLSPAQLDGLEARRLLLVELFDKQIASQGENAVLYDLPPEQPLLQR